MLDFLGFLFHLLILLPGSPEPPANPLVRRSQRQWGLVTMVWLLVGLGLLLSGKRGLLGPALLVLLLSVLLGGLMIYGLFRARMVSNLTISGFALLLTCLTLLAAGLLVSLLWYAPPGLCPPFATAAPHFSGLTTTFRTVPSSAPRILS